ncbi:TonB-dependent receptor [Halioxenophilus aromaticivorans]|uniref:TonB-dependent receptor n=1 Tax=Halioxenophilus aromaticivorans TaxID=1306992 RepID=A0AAV3U6R2_9ALTE
MSRYPFKTYSSLSLLTGFSLSLFSSELYAQLEEVVVTAERREASLQETDISMTVLGQQTLKEIGVDNYQQVGDMAPNVMMHESPGKVGGAISIRGFKNAETVSTFEPKVALYLDGVLIAKNSGSAFDVVDLERIEILRGPQGTLYGRNTVGGAVNLITAKPNTEQLDGSVFVTLGEYNQQDVRGVVNVPLTDTMAVKINLASLNRDGYFDNNFRNTEEADRDRLVGRLQWSWDISENANLLYAYDHTEVDEKPWPVTLMDYNPATHPQLAPYVSDGDNRSRNLDFATYQQAEVKGHSLTLNWDLLANASLVSITALREMSLQGGTDSDGTPEFVFATYSEDNTETFTQELRLVGNTASGKLEYVAGAFYMDEDIYDVKNVNVLPTAGYLESGLNADANNKVWALFGEATLALTEQVDLTFGLRYTEEDRTMSRQDFLWIPVLGAETITDLPEANGNFDDVSGVLSLSYQWTDDTMTYLKASKGYVSGGFNPRSPSPETFTEGYKEEIVYTYEFGWKTTLADNRLQLNGAVFYNDYQDLQVNLLDEATARNNIGNAGKAEIQGLEIEVVAKPIDTLDIGAGYGYLDTQYKTYIDPVSGADLSRNSWAHAPKNSFNAWMRWQMVQWSEWGDLSLRMDYSYRSDFALLTQNGTDVDGYDSWNARVTWANIPLAGGNLRASLWGKNLTNELWYTSGYNLVSVLGFKAQATNPPQTFGLDMEYMF